MIASEATPPVRLQRVGRGALGLVSCSVLVYQIAATRVLSVVLWYHFAFLSISVAMLGLGASAVWFSTRAGRSASLPRLLLAAGLAIPLSVWVIVHARPLVMVLGLGQTAWTAAVMLAMLAPMFLLGGAVCCLLLAASGNAVGAMYAADLLGATLGALLVVPCMHLMPTPSLLALTGVLPLLALAWIGGARKPAWIVASIAIVVAVVWEVPFRVSYSKLYAEEGERKPLYEVWTPTARITLFDRPIFSPLAGVPWGWGYGERFSPTAPIQQRWIDQDGSAGTPVERLLGAPSELGHLFYDVTSLAYQVAPHADVCIVGAGGGRDIVTALAAGAERVTGVEVNAAIAELMTGPLAGFSGDIYRRPGVHVAVDEGRSFLTRTREHYDLIQISLVDSWAATVAGAYSLSENYLYTVDAVRLYLQRLKRGGVLSLSRYTDRVQPFESARLILLVEEALRQEGVTTPGDHLLFMAAGPVGTLLVGKDALTDSLRAAADRVAVQRGFVRHWPPRAQEPATSLVAFAMADRGALLMRSGLDLRPPVDDRPYFFQAASVFGANAGAREAAPHDINVESVTTLRAIILLLASLSVLLFVAPAVAFARPERGAALWRGSGYFFLIGCGFMLLELPWMQRTILFLGQPSVAAATVLGSLLFAASVGAFVSTLPSPRARSVRYGALAATVVVTFGVATLFRSAIAYPFGLRLAIAVAVFACAGFGMGMAVPLGFVRFGERHKAWFWAMNGVASVLASALSIALAMTMGFFATSLVGLGCYAGAAILWRLQSTTPAAAAS